MDDELPENLRRALEAAYPTPAVPRGVDERVLRGARAHLLGRGRRRWFVGAIASSAVAAAVIAVAIPMLNSHFNGPHDPRDLNGDGQFNILDALAAANRGDDARHVDQLASAAVSLGVVR